MDFTVGIVSKNLATTLNFVEFIYGPCVVILNCLGQVLYLGRVPCTKETLADFREWCRVTRHPRVFRGLTSCQRTPRVLGCHSMVSELR